MEQLIQAINEALSGVRTAANSVLSGMPPIEQFEANQELSYGMRMLKQLGSDLIGQLSNLPDTLKAKLATVMAEQTKVGIAAEVAAGNLLAKADYEAAVNAAVAGARSEVEKDVTARFEKLALATAQRAVLLKDVPATLADKFPQDLLLADNAAASVDAFKARFKTLSEIGVNAETSAAFLEEVAEIPLTADGDAVFAKRVAPIKASFNASKAGAAIVKPSINPLTGNATLRTEEPVTNVNRFL